MRKASINVAKRQRSQDFVIQSSASSRSKDTGNEEGPCSDKRPRTSSLVADGNVDESERGQHLPAEPLTDRLADILPNLDLSLPVEFGQQSSDQDGDDIFSLTLSPLSFFSTNLPSTRPAPIQSTAARASENLLSPSLSSGDEIPQYLSPTNLDFMVSIYDSPTRQSQDPPFFEIGSNATPTFRPASTSVSTAFSSRSPSEQPCQCLAAVTFAVEDFEASCKSGNRAELDSIVACQKEAIKCCRSMLKCSSCMAKRESLVLLVFVTEKILAACGGIIVLYRVKDGNTVGAGSVPPSSLGCLPPDGLSHRVNVEDRGLATLASSSSPKTDCTQSVSIMSTRTGTDWRELLLGDYEINSPLEWEHLVGVLIFLQLRAVMELLADMKNMGSAVLGETQMASLAQAEIRVSELEKSIDII